MSRRKPSREALLMGPCRRARRGLLVPIGGGDTLLGWIVISPKGGHHGLAQWFRDFRVHARRTWQLLIKAESQDPPSGAQNLQNKNTSQEILTQV